MLLHKRQQVGKPFVSSSSELNLVLRAGALLWRSLVLGAGFVLVSSAALAVSPTRSAGQTPARTSTPSPTLIPIDEAANTTTQNTTSIPCTCIGDADKNGFVNFADFGSVQNNFGTAADPLTGFGDADCSGFVNFTDFGVVQSAFGVPCPLAASARVATEPLFRLFDFQARVGTPGGVAGRSIVPGCQQFDCIASGQVTGIEEDCCFDGQFTQAFEHCGFEDDLGRFVSLTGTFVLLSDNLAVCTGAIPVGGNFTASLSSFTHDVFFPDGSFSRIFQEVNETFEVTTGGCTVRQPEQLGFGIRGDGRRFIDGELQQFQTDAFGNVLVDSETDVHALEIVVGSTGQPDACTVTAALNGSVTSADFLAGTQFSTAFTDFDVVQPPQAGALLLGLNGTLGTDCLGEVTLSTVEPLQVAPGATCFTAGRLNAQAAGGTVSVTYGESGLDLDFGADGSAEQHFATCTDVPVDECTTSVVGLCGACTAASQCQGGLSCFPCSRDCSGDTARCSLADTFVTCEDGVF
jgi:hypothetical protein